MSKTLVLVWLGAQAARPALEGDLQAWARARWVRLAEPAADAPAGPGYDDARVASIEERLEQARIASGSLDDATALERLAALEKELELHPELPQAAWLLAEALEVRATVSARGPDGAAAAQALRQRARALQGPRSPTFGATDQAEPAAPPERSLRVRGLAGGDQVEWDGLARPRSLETSTGLHAVRVVRRGRVAWAGWVSVTSDTRELTLPVPPPIACSQDDLDGAKLRGGRVAVRPGVQCELWAVARPAPDGGVEVATCHGSSCGPLLRWKRRYGAVYEGPPQPPPEPGFPAWATYAIAGAGAALLTTAVLWQAGAFDDPAPGKSRWVFYGPNR